MERSNAFTPSNVIARINMVFPTSSWSPPKISFSEARAELKYSTASSSLPSPLNTFPIHFSVLRNTVGAERGVHCRSPYIRTCRKVCHACFFVFLSCMRHPSRACTLTKNFLLSKSFKLSSTDSNLKLSSTDQIVLNACSSSTKLKSLTIVA